MFEVEDQQELHYTLREENGRFGIYAASGRNIMVCDDEGSASQYVALLNESYRAGYKSGFRDGRRK